MIGWTWLFMMFFTRASIAITGPRVRGNHFHRLRLFASASDGAAVKRVVFLGTPDVAAKSLEMLAAASKTRNDFEVIAVVSQPPAPAGRNKKLTPSPVHKLAEELNLPLMTPESAKDEEFLSKLEALQPDLCITAAYGNFLPKRFLAIPKLGTLNIHPSLLPKYRGAAPVQRCLEVFDWVNFLACDEVGAGDGFAEGGAVAEGGGVLERAPILREDGVGGGRGRGRGG
jgi:hypothetical protein